MLDFASLSPPPFFRPGDPQFSTSKHPFQRRFRSSGCHGAVSQLATRDKTVPISYHEEVAPQNEPTYFEECEFRNDLGLTNASFRNRGRSQNDLLFSTASSLNTHRDKPGRASKHVVLRHTIGFNSPVGERTDAYSWRQCGRSACVTCVFYLCGMKQRYTISGDARRAEKMTFNCRKTWRTTKEKTM